jgi:hypothetical protein
MSTATRLFVVLALLLALLGFEGCGVTSVLVPHPSERLIEVRSATPGTDFHWVTGHYRWDEALKKYTWVGGQWERVLPGHRWLSGRYGVHVLGELEVKQWNPGRWVAQRRSAGHGDGNKPDRDVVKDSSKPEPGSIQ